MKKLVLSIGLLLLGSLSASAASIEGTFRCKNFDGLPENIYSVRSVSVGGISVPYVEATRFYRKKFGDPSSPIEEARMSGFASVSEAPESTELMLAALRLQFKDGKMVGCTSN